MTSNFNKNKKKFEFIQELIKSDSLKINDLISGKEFSSKDVKSIKILRGSIELEVCDKEIQLIVDDEILSCFTKEELDLIQSELAMEFPFAVITIIDGTEHTVITRGLSSLEKDIVTYNIRRVFEDTIANLN